MPWRVSYSSVGVCVLLGRRPGNERGAISLCQECVFKRCFIWRKSGEVGLFSFFLSLHIQSMRSTVCVKAQIIWTCTSRWSGSIMNTARSCPLSRSTYLNIQRECFLYCLHTFPATFAPAAQKTHIAPSVFFFFLPLQLVWAICHHVVGWKWGSVQRFSPWSPGEGQKRRGNCFYSHLSYAKQNATLLPY